ncbi:MAG: acyl-CoA synthetase [Alphaproteobacteria bacterium]|jgi:acyl-CoA synthetase|nr:acyl-CoA synthetase [Alphaproteobacteria bacterium]
MSALLTLQDVARARQFYEHGYWGPETLYDVLRRRAEETPSRFAFRDSNTRLTYGAALRWVDALAQELHDAGLRSGDRVSIWLPSRIETALIFFACSRMGYVCNTSLHRDYTCNDILALLKRAGSAAFFGQAGYGADAAQNSIFEMLNGLPRLKKVCRVEPLQPGIAESELPIGFGSFRDASLSRLAHASNPDRIVYLAFTSGTTGQPKGVMHSDNTILANGRAIAKDWGFDQDTIVYSFSPLSHNIGIVGMAVAAVCGGEFVAHTPLDASRMLDRIVETGATYVLGVPTHAIDLLTEMRQRGMARLGQVKAFQLGGAPVPPTTVRGLMDVQVKIQNAFGMTENHSFQYTRPADLPETIASTCGRPADGMEIKLWREDDQDREVVQGDIGELGVRGASLMLGYFDDQSATELSFNREGWFMTGDLARLDDQGNLQIAGRKKDVIIRGGHNIYPVRIEDYTLRHTGVAKAAAFPVADERLGERVCLAVIPRTNAKTAPLELLQHLNDQGLSKYDMPEFFLELDQFPLTASGKVLKRRLVEMVAQGLLKPQPVRWSG